MDLDERIEATIETIDISIEDEFDELPNIIG